MPSPAELLGHASPKASATKVVFHATGGCGGCHLFSPAVDAAKGMPLKDEIVSQLEKLAAGPEVLLKAATPWTGPYFVLTTWSYR